MSQQLNLKIKYLKLKRIDELNNNLKNELQRDRITASNACLSIINYTQDNKDYTIPTIWGYPKTNHFHDKKQNNNTLINHSQSNFNNNINSTSTGCCTIM